MTQLRLALMCAALAGGLAGCTSSGSPGSGKSLFELAAPATPPAPRAVLNLAGTEIGVEVVAEKRPNQLDLSLVAFGEALEMERYVAKPDRFALLEAVGETFDPPATLLDPGTRSGKRWKWSGRVVSGGVSRKADAVLEATAGPIEVAGKSVPGVHVHMELSIDSGLEQPAERTLDFFFVEGKGLAMREFGQASIRAPAAEPDPKER